MPRKHKAPIVAFLFAGRHIGNEKAASIEDFCEHIGINVTPIVPLFISSEIEYERFLGFPIILKKEKLFLPKDEEELTCFLEDYLSLSDIMIDVVNRMLDWFEVYGDELWSFDNKELELYLKYWEEE